MSLTPAAVEALVTQLETDGELLRQIVQGGEAATVETENGTVPSLAKQLADIRTGLSNGLSATSASSLVIATGEKVFAIAANKFFSVGHLVLANSAADPTKWMLGTITGYAGTVLTVDVAATNGAGTFEDWIIGLSGLRGPQGAPGDEGASAYQVAVNNGFVGDEPAWLAWLQAEDGDDGASAYVVAVSNGFVGDEAAWLASLNGDDGTNGVGVPAGGTTGQVLSKTSNADHDTVWVDPSTGGASTWAELTGEISENADLQAELDAKANASAVVMALDGKQDANSNLDEISSLTTTGFGRGFLELVDAAAARSLLNLGDPVEVGFFTPSLAGLSVAGSHTYNKRVGNYERFANGMVWVSIKLSFVTVDAAMSGVIRITDLPFVSADVTDITALLTTLYSSVTYPAGGTQAYASIGQNVNYANVGVTGSGVALGNIDASGVGNSSFFFLSGLYRAA